MRWRLKIVAKIVLSRLHVPYRTWQRLGIFRHGAMDDPGYAMGVVTGHLERAGRTRSGFTLLELGPGDALLTALCARALGAGHIYLVDVGRYAVADVAPYRELARQLREAGHEVPDIDDATSVGEIVGRCGAEYLTGGLESLRTIPSGSVDVSFSQAVLEHVRGDEVPALFAELHRIHRPGTSSSHRVDLQDHLDHSLNNLRFSDRRWERDLIRRSGFYTNRLGYLDFCRTFHQAGFEVDIVDVTCWNDLPIPRAKLDPTFRGRSDAELLVDGFDVVLRRPLDAQRSLTSGDMPMLEACLSHLSHRAGASG